MRGHIENVSFHGLNGNRFVILPSIAVGLAGMKANPPAYSGKRIFAQEGQKGLTIIASAC